MVQSARQGVNVSKFAVGFLSTTHGGNIIAIAFMEFYCPILGTVSKN